MRNKQQSGKYGRKLPPAQRPKFDLTNNHRYLDDVEDEATASEFGYNHRYQDQDYKRALGGQRRPNCSSVQSLYNSWNLPSDSETSIENHAGKRPKGYRRSDERIYEEVCEALTSHLEIDPSNVEVKVVEGVVTFSGTVENRQMKRLVEDVTEHLPGVFDVRNELTFKTSSKII